MMVYIWKPCGVHLKTICCPHCNHIVLTWKPHVIHVETTWKPCGFYMKTMWFLHENHMVSMTFFECSLKLAILLLWVEMMSFLWWDTTRWKQCHFHIISMGGNDVSVMWKPSGFHGLPGLWLEISLETTNFVVSLLSPCCFHSFHMDSMWF